MGGYGDVKLLREDGKRLDGRAIDEMRPVTIEAGVLPAADGSAMVTHGLNVAVAAVYGPMEAHPRKIQRQDRAVIDVRYNMAPFSTGDRIRPRFNRRSREISKVTAESLESVVLVGDTLAQRFELKSRFLLLRLEHDALVLLLHLLHSQTLEFQCVT